MDRVSGFDFESFERDFGKEIIHRFHFATNLETSITQQSVSRVRVYPNPTSGMVRIDAIGFGRTLSYALYDAFGRKIDTGNIMRKTETETFELSLESRPKGLYFVELLDGTQRGTIRLIKS